VCLGFSSGAACRGLTSFSSRVLTPTELGTLWRALDGEGVVGDVFRVLVLTGQRIGEVRGMRWDEIDLETGWWTIPGTRTKNKSWHRVPLVGEALRNAHEPRTETANSSSRARARAAGGQWRS
jgi:integrase